MSLLLIEPTLQQIWKGSARQLDLFISARRAYNELKDIKSKKALAMAYDRVKVTLREMLKTKRGYEAAVIRHYLKPLK